MELLKNQLKSLRNQQPKLKKWVHCPKCGYNSEQSSRATTLPTGVNASLLLDSSPTPQMLLSESNLIVYANKSAARIIRVINLESEIKISSKAENNNSVGPVSGQEDPVSTDETPDLPGMKRAEFKTMDADAENEEENEQDDENEKKAADTMAAGLRGRTLDQLNIEIVDEDLRRWVTLTQVFENIKISLSKREAKMSGDEDMRAEMYGEGPKYKNYDYYGDLERAKMGGIVEPDRVLRDTIPVVITKEDGGTMEATMYVTLIDPYSTGSSYSSVTLVPRHPTLLKDATFSDQMAQPKETQRVRKRDKLKAKFNSLQHHDEALEAEVAALEVEIEEEEEANAGPYSTGKSGADMIKRVARLKDLILDEMEYSFIALSPDGDIVITNKATKAVLGAETLQASIGEGFEWIARLDIWRPDFSERLPFEEWALNKLITHHKPLSQVIGLYAGDYPLIVELRGTCIWEDPEKEEGLIAALAIVVNQTQWFTKEKAMQATQFKQGLFLSNISRELRTPVAGIVGLLEILYRDGKNFDAQQRKYIQQIFGSVNNLLLVVNNIVDFNKIESGDTPAVRSTFVLQDIVEELRTLFSGSMGTKDVAFEVDTSLIDKSAFGSGDRLLLLGDDAKIRKIAINLLSNAFKYTTEGKVTLVVLTGQVQRNSLEVRFEIKDTGLGLSEEDQKKLFMQLDEIPTEEAKQQAYGKARGTGIGLNLAQKYASLIGGSMGCTSVLNKGSTFWFTVPCGRPNPDSTPDLQPIQSTLSKEMGLVISSEELMKDPYSQTPVKDSVSRIYIIGTIVMLVEDNWAHQMVMQKRLEKVGCQVITAVNGQDAISRLKRPDADVDIIFMDIQMPLLDGFEATKLIRTDPELEKWRAVPVIGLTATELKGDRQKAAEYGLDEFTVKPLNAERCLHLIEKMLDPIAVAEKRRSIAAKERTEV